MVIYLSLTDLGCKSPRSIATNIDESATCSIPLDALAPHPLGRVKNQIVRAVTLDDGQNNFIEPSFNNYCMWYRHHLHQHVVSFIRPNASSLSLSEILTEDEMQHKNSLYCLYRKLFEIMGVTLELLRDGESSIEAVATSLSQKEVVLESISRSNSCHQLIFILLSWTTMLFNANENPIQDTLQLSLCASSDPTIILRSRAWRKLTSPIEQLTSLPLKHLLARFGEFAIFPMTISHPLASKSTFQPLLASNFGYETLSKVANINIQWVDAVTLHMEFDERTATLKLFRFPSFCAMICLSPREGSSTLFSQCVTTFRWNPSINQNRLFSDQDHVDEDAESISEEILRGQPYSRHFFLEVICSFRLIFGQHSRALYGWDDFKWSPAQISLGIDPLLKELCSEPCRKTALYEQIDAPRVKPVYVIEVDFPYLGERLAELQDYVEQQNPGDLMALWHDRRDILRFHTYWAVIFIGGLSIILSAAQLAVSVASYTASK